MITVSLNNEQVKTKTKKKKFQIPTPAKSNKISFIQFPTSEKIYSRVSTKMNSHILLLTCLVLLTQLYAKSLNAIENNNVDEPHTENNEHHHHQQHHRHHVRHHHGKNATMWTILGHTLQSDGTSIETEKIKYKYEHSEHDGKVKNCPKCDSRPELRMTEKDLTKLRIEYVKNQILKKLRLTERPQVSASNIPKPVADGATFYQENAPEQTNRAPDEFYGKTTQRIIFPKLGKQMFKSFFVFVFLSTFFVSSTKMFLFVRHNNFDSRIKNKRKFIRNAKKNATVDREKNIN